MTRTSAAVRNESRLSDLRLEKLLYAVQLGQGIGNLRFVPALEPDFRDEYVQAHLRRLRTGFVAAIVLYLAFLIMRMLTESGPAADLGLMIRAVIIGSMLLLVAGSYVLPRRQLTPLVMLTYVVFGAGVTAIECVAQHYQIDRRYEGLIFISIHCYVFGGLLFRQACATTFLIFCTYAIGGWLGGLAGKSWAYELFFLLVINIMGVLALYLLEYADRENYLRRHIIREMAIRDGLTGLFNRTAFLEHCERLLKQAAREAQGLALLIFDLDYFKQYNDEYGHLGGDECLRTVAEAVSGTARRPLDILARFGGEEFVGIWYGVAPGAAEPLAEGVRSAVAGLDVPHAKSPLQRVTVSVGGIGFLPRADETVESLLKQADDALYEAKAAGRNRAVVRVREPGLRLAAAS